jgi:[acyl-carrier-protein] S-malonyltransferase
MSATTASRRVAASIDEASVGFVFPGQGSQYPGMVREVQRCGPAARALLDRAEQVTGLPVRELMTTADADTLADPHIAQVLVFVTSTVLLHELRQRGWAPSAVAGHSLGEYPALVAADVLTWEDALRLVDARGAVMSAAAAVEPGAMAAVVGLDPATAAKLCRSASRGREQVVIANVNSPTQLVVSGTQSAVVEVIASAGVAGALRARLLPVGGAYHSPLMQPAATRLRPLLQDVQLSQPRTALVSSATGQVVDDLDEYRQALADQVTSPVRWQRTVKTLADLGVDCFVEVGPSRVLTGLGRENARAAARHTAPDLLAHLAATPGVDPVTSGV